MTGVLITTDKNKEKNAVRDAYNILNDAVEHLYPNLDLTQTEEVDNKTKNEEELEKPNKKQKISETESKPINSENISDLLDNEIKLLKKKTKFFYNFDTNCKGVVFIKLEKTFKDKLDIKAIVEYIIDNTNITKQQVSKNIARFIPVEIATKAKYDNFIKQAPLLLDKYFTKDDNGSKTWKVEMKVRNNNSIKKDEYLNFVWNHVDRNKYSVDFKNPKFTVLIEITNDTLCMSVLEGYFEKKCYNLLSLSKSEEELQMEREKLINMQIEAEKRKLDKKQKDLENVNKGVDNEDVKEDEFGFIEDSNKPEGAAQGIIDNGDEQDDEDEDIQII
jgi:tRNA acetyltransferase TAN1